MGFAADRRELEHGVEGRNLEHADRRHVEHLGDVFDRLFRYPTARLLLGAPQDRNHGGGLPAFGVFGDLALRPSEVLGREGETGGLLVGESADGHYVKSYITLRLRNAYCLPQARADRVSG